MANALQCDICGEFFVPKKDFVNIVRFGYHTDGENIYTPRNLMHDICPECKVAIYQLMEERKAKKK